MAIREKLSYANTEHHKAITSMDKIIRGAVLMKWMYLLATIFFIIFGAYFLFMVYPEIQFMLVILGFLIGGYAITFFGSMVQIKIFNRTIEKVRLTLKMNAIE